MRMLLAEGGDLRFGDARQYVAHLLSSQDIFHEEKMKE